MSALFRCGPLTIGQPAQVCALSPGALTTAVNRFERAGYAQRVRSGSDRRRVLVELTAAARQRIAEIWGPMAAEAQATLAGCSARDLRLLRDFLAAGTDLQRRHAPGEGRRFPPAKGNPGGEGDGRGPAKDAGGGRG